MKKHCDRCSAAHDDCDSDANYETGAWHRRFPFPQVAGEVHRASQANGLHNLALVAGAEHRLTYRYFSSRCCAPCWSNGIVQPKFPPPFTIIATFSHLMEPQPVDSVSSKMNSGGSEMDEGAELATAGLVVAFAAVLLVASHFFIEAQSAKQLVKGSIDLKVQTNVIGSWL